ncbi:integrase core domain-containing protein [Nitrosospira sp. Nsp2]|uniref:integrase core domain-containing protein n=1 Tax=Nitrosospira sp. Nsp2 TaxID=136548 RepID=UPI0035BF7385
MERHNHRPPRQAGAHYLFNSIEEVQDYATRWLWTYNHERPKMALGGITRNRNWPWSHDLYFQAASKMGGLPPMTAF